MTQGGQASIAYDQVQAERQDNVDAGNDENMEEVFHDLQPLLLGLDA